MKFEKILLPNTYMGQANFFPAGLRAIYQEWLRYDFADETDSTAAVRRRVGLTVEEIEMIYFNCSFKV